MSDVSSPPPPVLQRFRFLLGTAISTTLAIVPHSFAQNGINTVPDIGNLPGGTSANSETLMSLIVSIVELVLNFIAILAVIFIIIAGIRLIVSQGEEEQKEKAKKTIIYVIIGLIVIILARMIVGLTAGTILNTVS